MASAYYIRVSPWYLVLLSILLHKSETPSLPGTLPGTTVSKLLFLVALGPKKLSILWGKPRKMLVDLLMHLWKQHLLSASCVWSSPLGRMTQTERDPDGPSEDFTVPQARREGEWGQARRSRGLAMLALCVSSTTPKWQFFIGAL